MEAVIQDGGALAVQDNAIGRKLEAAGASVLRYGLVLVLLWIGGIKFTAYEAEGIQPLVAHSPLMAWVYSVFSVRGFSMFLGVVEITTGTLIALRFVRPQLAVAGSLIAVVMFLTTLSFLLTTPGVWQMGYGFPALSGAVGGFLIKDVVLLGAALWSAGEAMRAAPDRSHPNHAIAS